MYVYSVFSFESLVFDWIFHAFCVFDFFIFFRYIIFWFPIPYFYLKCYRLLWILCIFLVLMSCKCPVFLYFVSCKMSCIFITACYDHCCSFRSCFRAAILREFCCRGFKSVFFTAVLRAFFIFCWLHLLTHWSASSSFILQVHRPYLIFYFMLNISYLLIDQCSHRFHL